MKIAITTPTGKIGSKLVARLLADGEHDLVLLARKPEKVKTFTDKGATAVKSDLTDVESVKKATQGVDSLFWVNPPNYQTDDIIAYYHTLAENAAAAVKANNIERVVFLSSIGAHLGKGVGPVNGFKAAEETLRKACKNLVILRPTYFMENYLISLDGIKNDGNVYLPIRGDATMSMIATEDIAATAANVLEEPFEGYSVRPLLGPREYTFTEAADAIGHAIGKEVHHVQVTPEQALNALKGMGLNDNLANAFVEMYTAIDTGYMKAEKPRSATSTTPTTIQQFAERVIKPATT